MAPIMRLSKALVGLLLSTSVLAADPARLDAVRRQETAAPTATADAPEITAISDCHLHGSDVYCMAGSSEVQVKTTAPTKTEELPSSFTGCHSHGDDMFCMNEDGDDVQILTGSEGDHDHEEEDNHSAEGESSPGLNCHFHAGVEHCVGAGESEGGSAARCDKVDREYNIPLRVGLIFAILATSAIGVFGPIFLAEYLPAKLGVIMVTLKQFGTGIIISTAFVHLFVHATLMFQNQCLQDLGYEGTAAAILMAGLFISFLVEYFGERIMKARLRKKVANTSPEDLDPVKHNASIELINIMVMEAGIIFHSLIIGVTLVVSGDSFFITLFIVIVFHQFFEGLALGSRIAALGTSKHYALSALGHHAHHHHVPEHSPSTDPHCLTSPTHSTNPDSMAKLPADAAPSLQSGLPHTHSDSDDHHDREHRRRAFPMSQKIMLASAFAFVTPVGMAIGTAALSVFNGNDPTTIIAIGTLDAFSAGILVWVGLVEMWAADWMGGEMSEATPFVAAMGMFGLVAGMALMSFLGKWA